MNTSTLKVNAAIAERLGAFLKSELFTIHSDVAKSDYWKYYGAKLNTNINGDLAEIAGESGFYVPESSFMFKRATRKIVRVIKQPTKIAGKLRERVASLLIPRGLMSYEQAFDAIMAHAEVSDPIMSPHRVDLRKLQKHPKVFTDSASINLHYKTWSRYKASPSIIGHYYHQNMLRGFVEEDQLRTVLDIGAGNGNFPSILYHDWAPLRVILIDLPETLAIAIPFLSNLFPQAKLAMPHEIKMEGVPAKFDFAFLTVDQLECIADNSIDLVVNCDSFQEMTRQQIETYFKLAQRVGRDGSYFFTSNRTEKIPCGGDAYSVEQLAPPNRFAEYPWNTPNEVLVYETCRLNRLVQLDDASIRLERVRK